MIASPTEVKSCCAAAYGDPAARWLLGEHLHPGGGALTSELAAALAVGPGQLVADVACGPGASSLQFTRETGCNVIGIDISPESLQLARGRVEAAGLAGRAQFLEGDAEALPLENASVDGVLCECALCTFPDKPAAVRELARVLRAGARLAFSDMTAEPQRLPPQLRTLPAWIACLADARPLAEVAELLECAGFTVESCEPRDDALAALLERVDGRLRIARMLGDGAQVVHEETIHLGFELLAAARTALARGALGYGTLIARR
jgi:arsenite methyltransferase